MKKEKVVKAEEQTVKYGFKRWFFGLGKEFNRIS
jgi:hypothetical protein